MTGRVGGTQVTDIQQALADGEARLRELKVGLSTRTLATLALRAFRKREAREVLDALQALQAELDQVSLVLREVYEQGRAAERAEAAAAPFGDAWLSDLRRSLTSEETAAFTGQRVDAWMQALAAGEWERCAEVVGLRHPGRDESELRRHLKLVLDEVRRNPGSRTASGLAPALEAIARADMSRTTRIQLLVLRARVLRRQGHDDLAVEAAQQATELAAQAEPIDRSLARAALAEALTAADRLDEAGRLLADELERSDPLPDTLIAAGQLAIEEGFYGRCNDCFEAAALRFGAEAGRPRLLRDVPGNLLTAIARGLGPFDNAALALYDAALEAGMAGRSAHPERKVYLEKAHLLENLGRYREAAQAYLAAAERYAALGLNRAERLFAKACELNPSDPRAYWGLGEHLRSRAVDADGIIDRVIATRAAAALRDGIVRAGEEVPAWPLVSSALAEDVLAPGGDHAAAIERAMLIDPTYTAAFGYEAGVLRGQGFPLEALELAEQGQERTDGDVALLGEQLAALTELGQAEQALAALGRYQARFELDVEFALWSPWLHLKVGRTGQAAAEIRAATVGDEIDRDLLLGVILAAANDADGERECFERVWASRASYRSRAGIGWAAFRLGRLDDAVEIFTGLAERAPASFGRQSDLAQAQLVRGAAGSAEQLAAAGDRLYQAIAVATMADDLEHAVMLEFPLAQHTVRDAEFAAEATAILDEAIRAGHERLAELRTRRRGADLLSVRLANARLLARTDPLAAVGAYRELESEVPDGSARAVAAIMATVIDRGGHDLAANDVAAARHAWDELDAVVGDRTTDAALRNRLNALRGLAALELDGPTDDAAKLLSRADEIAIPAGLTWFARDVATAWAHHDGLKKIAERQGLEDDARRRIVAAVGRIPLDRVYALHRDDVPTESVSPLARATEIALSPAHAELAHSDYFGPMLAALRKNLTTTTGVKIPGVRVYVDEALPEDAVRIAIYERPMRQASVPVGPGAGDAVIERFEEVLKQNLFRWISVDDIELWLAGWGDGIDPELTTAAAGLDPVARLRLARVLRDLLREGVSINDRRSILAGMQSAPGPDVGEALRAVRSRLFPATVGGDPGAPRMELDPTLTQRLSAGLLANGSGGWQAGREEVASLAATLRAWLDAHPETKVVMVGDQRLRQVVWRLLAACRPRVYVIAAEEQP
jgi:tetratricopeptide (TPR) repeat protein